MPTEDEQCSVESEATEIDARTDVTGESSPAGEPTPVAEIGEAAESADVVVLIERLAAEMAGLRADFAAKIRYDEVKEQQIARMHDELQAFRAGLHLRLLQPVFTDLITMHDDLADALVPDGPKDELESLRESILETLSRNGVASYSVHSDGVDRSRQRVIRTVETGDESLDHHVQRRIRVGFEYDNGKIIRPEWVAAYRYTRAAHETAAPVGGGE